MNGQNGLVTANTIFYPNVYFNNQNVSNNAKITYSPNIFTLNQTATYPVTIKATYNGKTAYTSAIVYVCQGSYKCNSSGTGCTK